MTSIVAAHEIGDEFLELIDSVMYTIGNLGLFRRWHATHIRARQRKTAINTGFAWLLTIAFQSPMY